MLRESLMKKHQEAGFCWRGGEIARVEGLSDAVFAFAVTLLVVSLEVPKTFNELMAVMRGFVPFAISFALLMQVWHEQYRYFRRYNLQDSTSTFLNCALLFVVLFYVYPLKFLWTFLVNSWTGHGHAVQVHLPDGSMERMIEPGQVAQLMGIFSGGYLAVSCIFLLLFLHALRKRDQLELNARELHLTRVSIGAVMIQAFAASVSLAMVLFGGERYGGPAGLIYPILLGPGFTIYYTVMARKERRLAAA
jgi:hypothetical protein